MQYFLQRGVNALFRGGESDGAGIGDGVHGDVHCHGVIGQDVGYSLGPFKEAEGSGVEIVLNANVKGFLHGFEPVEVEMVYQFGCSGGAVFVDD